MKKATPKKYTPRDLQKELREAYIANNYELAKKIQKEIDYFNYGIT